MLGIKDNVDLKELEKFGFEIINTIYTKNIDDGRFFIKCFEDTREILIENNENKFGWRLENDQLYTLYDLIKADLVEKVGDR